MARQEKSGLFRREALDRLDDVDELDHLVTVTHPRAWLALGAVAVLIVVALAWASFGRLDTTVAGEGILLTGGRTLSISTLESGRLDAADRRLGRPCHRRGRPWHGSCRRSRRRDRTEAQCATPSRLPTTAWSARCRRSPASSSPPARRSLTVEPADQPLVATLFLPLDAGKKIKKGQEVQIVPATASVDEYGYLRARVTFVADLASTPSDMDAVLQNEFLTRAFSASRTGAAG